ncbi:polycystin family receptor for egg jelly [Dryobates pubescens]|uniref:polycystin family receptor for egg jelly n=1 Tax=Dryobates pubescens TaxID=118200 RepID=UPI0023B9A0C8|nr:polycystin family receptor for egg jelly [Dryobates pubescens]
MLQRSLLPGSTPPPVASSLLTVEHSSASCVDFEVHVLSSSHPASLQSFTYLVRFVPAQDPTLQCAWTFRLQLFGTQKGLLLQNSTDTYDDHLRKTATHLVRRSALPFDPKKSTGFVAKVKCTRSSLTPGFLRVRVNHSAARAIEAPTSCQQEFCQIYDLYIQKPYNTTILNQKRGTSFYLFVRLLLQCNVAISVKSLWRIYAVRDTTTDPDWSKPLNTDAMHGVEMIVLTVPSYTLDFGLYLFYFTVEINPIRTTTILRGSDKVYILIEGTDLVANIAGGAFRTVGFSNRWILNGSASYDPDSQEGLKGMTFTWYCTKEVADYETMTLSPGKKCHPYQKDLKWVTPSGPVQTVPRQFLPGKDTYYFRLVVEKGGRSSYADQTVSVKPGSPLLLDVTCIENCGKALIPTERFVLSGKCLNCRSYNKPVYYWSLFSRNFKEISFDWSSRTTTGRHGAYLSIHAQTFTKAVQRSYLLLLNVTTLDGRASMYRRAFKINSPPKAGKCTINPRWGRALQTKFVVACRGFSDRHTPLTYKVVIASDVSRTTKITSVEENTFGTILYFGYQPKTPPSFLPVGVPSQNYRLTLYVQVSDSLGAFTQVNLYTQVENPVSSQPPAAPFQDLMALVSRLSKRMTSYLQTGDYFSAGYLNYLAASLLNYIKATPALQLPTAQLREDLIRTALNISAESTMEANQVVASICHVTEDADEVNRRSQDLAIKKLAEVTGVLNVWRHESQWSEQAEIQSSGILSCLSNVLRAALLNRRSVNVDGVKQVVSITENLTEIVFQGKVPGDIDTLMGTKKWNITLKKEEAWNMTSAFSDKDNCRNCFYPLLEKGNYSGLSPDAVISTALFEFDENPFPWLRYTSEIATMVLGFKMAENKDNGHLLGIMPEKPEIIVVRKDKESSTFQLAIGPGKTQAHTTGGFSLEINKNTTTTYFQILTNLQVTFKVLVFTGTNVTHAYPIATFDAFHDKATVARETETASTDCNIETPYIICLPESLLRATAQGSSGEAHNISIVLQTPYVVSSKTQSLVSIHIFSDQCLFLDNVYSQWRQDTCMLGPMTNWQRVHCVCNLKQRRASRTVTSTSSIRFLAAKVIVAPNIVDLEKALIADIHSNLVTLLTVLFIFAVYVPLAIWAMRKDRADRADKCKVIVLPDNDPFDKVRYLVTLYTGSRCGAGTTADVFLQLYGQKGKSDAHCLRHPYFPSLRQGSIDFFLLTVKKDLGDICILRMWHNNKGSSPGWFLSRAEVVNMSTRKIWFFVCRKWFSVDKGDHLLERTFSVTDPKAPLHRTDYFLINLVRSLTEGHLWLSVFARAPTGTFSRLQRLSCCLAILLLNLFVNIMFFNAHKNEESSAHMNLLRSIMVGIECALITLPVEILIIALFNYSQKDPPPPGTRSKFTPPFWNNCTIPERDANVIVTEEQMTTTNSLPIAKAPLKRRPPADSNFSSNYAEEGGNLQKERKPLSSTSTLFLQRARPVCHRWRTCLSWALVVAVSGLSSFFIVLYGLSYGYQISLEWLLASVVSFIENVFFLSFLKIILLSAVSSICRKRCENIAWLSQEKYSELKVAEEMLSADEMRAVHLKLAEIRRSKYYQPLEADEMANMLERARIKAKAFLFIKDLISHLLFLTLFFYFIYSNDNIDNFHYNRFIHNQFSPGLSSVDKLEDIYRWVKDSFLPLIHSDSEPTFLSESWSKILGLPRMRQVRAKDTRKKCFHPHSSVNHLVISKSHCLHVYGTDIPETGHYAGTWTKAANQSVSKDASSYDGFTYQQNTSQWMYYSYGDLHTYGPAGYTFYFFPNERSPNSTIRLNALEESYWLDDKTWAVITELTTFNSDVDLFCTISVIFEMSGFGIVKPSLAVHSFALPILRHQTKAQRALFAIVIAFLLIYIAEELYTVYQEKKDYIKNISNIINLGLKSAFLLFVLLKIIKYKMGEDIVNFYLLHPHDFIHFHAVSHLDQSLRISMGFLGFLAILKTLKYFQLVYDVRLVQRSILAALPGISSTALMVLVYFFAFIMFGYLVFGQHEQKYNSIIHSAQTIFSYCVSAFSDTPFSSNRLVGAIFLASFTLVMICVLIHLFQAVIMSAYEDMKRQEHGEPSDEAQVATFLLQRLKNLLSLLKCKRSQTSKPGLFHNILHGKPERRHQQDSGFKNKQKRKWGKFDYFVI